MDVLHRAAPGKGAGLDFVLSDENPGRDGLVIRTAGWDTRDFVNNPIALFSHDARFPIGTWANVRMEGGRLIATLKLAAKGTSARLDELISLVEQGILRACSVGFRIHAMDGSDIVTQAELTEASLVSVPALPSALAMARSLDISADTMALVFGEYAARDQMPERRRSTGEHAVTPPSRKPQKMETLSQKIERAQGELTASRDKLTELTDLEVRDLDAEEELHGKIDTQVRALAALQRSESLLAVQGDGPGIAQLPGAPAQHQRNDRRPFAIPAKKVDPQDFLIRSLATRLMAHVRKEPVDAVRQSMYGDDEGVRTVLEHQRAASAPATTTTTGWAAELVQTVNASFLNTLTPQAIYPSLSSRGMRLTFGRNGIISLPYEEATPTIAGSFVAEGAPIPVRQGAFNAITLTPKKMAVISTFTREIAEMSTPAIETLIRSKIDRDTTRAIDTVLLDATAASTIRPAGIRNGVTVTTATAGGGYDALVADLKALVGALVTASGGNLRSPVWLMNPVQALAIGLTHNTGGDMPFKAEIGNNTLLGFPVIQSGTVTAGMVILIDADDFVSVNGDSPMFTVTDVATLHMEDTTPTAIGTAGTPTVVAAPVRSLFQTDSIGIRMILPMNWAKVRAGTVAFTESVTW